MIQYVQGFRKTSLLQQDPANPVVRDRQVVLADLTIGIRVNQIPFQGRGLSGNSTALPPVVPVSKRYHQACHELLSVRGAGHPSSK